MPQPRGAAGGDPERTRRPLVVRYDDFALRAPGQRLAALPPFDLTSNEYLPIPDDYPYPWSGFQLAPHLTPYYRGFWNTMGTVEHDLAYYQRYHREAAAAGEVIDMMRRYALPEGILEPGGYITGTLYFADPEAAPSALTASFADARSARQVAVLDVPLEEQR